MRSAKHFDQELQRLNKQHARPETLRANSGNRDVGRYIQCHVAKNSLEFVETPELRNQAQKMADNRLTDRKKAIIIMIASGMNQSEVANALGISRQAVSKAIKVAIPKNFLLEDGAN